MSILFRDAINIFTFCIPNQNSLFHTLLLKAIHLQVVLVDLVGGSCGSGGFLQEKMCNSCDGGNEPNPGTSHNRKPDGALIGKIRFEQPIIIRNNKTFSIGKKGDETAYAQMEICMPKHLLKTLLPSE